MNNFLKGFATIVVCGILVIGCTASSSSEAEEQMEVNFTEISRGLSRAIDCRTGIVLYKYSGEGITSQKLGQTTLESFGCVFQ